MPLRTKDRPQQKQEQTEAGRGQRGIVICIDSRLRQPPERTPRAGLPPITQERLARGLELHLEEIRIARALREFRMQLDADLAAGSPIEPGDLVFDSELKIVRRRVPGAAVNR